MITHKQLSLADIFHDCQNKFDNDKYQFLTLLDEAINLDEIVPVSFVIHFHAHTGRLRKHQLYPIIKALLLQRIFSIPTDSLMILFLFLRNSGTSAALLSFLTLRNLHASNRHSFRICTACLSVL